MFISTCHGIVVHLTHILHLKQGCIMSILNTDIRPLDHPKLSLLLCFLAWKILLLCIAIASPGPGYDTSTTLLQSEPNSTKAISISPFSLPLRLEKLVRWDAIYFTLTAQRGYTWEQEWAFGWGFTKLIALMSKGISPLIIGRS